MLLVGRRSVWPAVARGVLGKRYTPPVEQQGRRGRRGQCRSEDGKKGRHEGVAPGLFDGAPDDPHSHDFFSLFPLFNTNHLYLLLRCLAVAGLIGAFAELLVASVPLCGASNLRGWA